MSSGSDPVLTEALRVQELTQQMLTEYSGWGGLIEHGEISFGAYYDYFDFVNFRLETADSCLTLIKAGRVADALGLCRALFENYLLFMLMTRGFKYFRLQTLEDKSPAEFTAYLKRQKAEVAELQAKGETRCLAVEKYPRAKRHLMYIFEGLRDNQDQTLLLPLHFFQFQQFHPETMRLKDEDYSVYYEPPPELSKALKGQRSDAVHSYRHYLSYDALLQCLELNGLADKAVQARLEAHYT